MTGSRLPCRWSARPYPKEGTIADARGACAAAGICEGEELDQVIVDRRRGRLHEEDLLAAHGIDKLYGNLAVGIRSSIQAPT
jgi:hypothetical protein